MAKLAGRIMVDPEQCGGRPCACGIQEQEVERVSTR